jgi:eukaryotic-like serine/threonine-protein kinase
MVHPCWTMCPPDSSESPPSGSGQGSRSGPRDADTAALEADTIVERPGAGSEAAADDEALTPGTRLGRYVVLEEIGAGGMGLVYSAYDPELNRKVALKLLRPRHREKKRTRSRLLQEAQALAKLAHPNVITVYDVGTLGDRVFVAMELVEGDTLKGWLDETKRKWDEVLSVFIPAGRGLSAAHAANLIHRDFKPDNVLIGRDGRVRVMDFGLARPARTDHDTGSSLDEPAARSIDLQSSLDPLEANDVEDPMLTQTGSIMGTPAFMAPEQHLGKVTDHRSDQYSFCVALYGALYGQRPFAGTDAGSLARAKADGRVAEPPPGVRVPAWVRRIVVRGLSPNPADRYPAMDELLDALADDPRIKRRKILTAGGTIVAMLGGVLGVQYVRSQQPSVCQGSPEVFATVWDDERKAAAAAGVLAIDRDHVRSSWTVAAATIDAYGEAWAQMHREACEATHVRGEQSTRLLELRNSCLQERLDEVDALASLFADADARTATRATDAALGIAPLSSCADSEALAAAVDPPELESTKTAVADLRRDLARAKALESVGKLGEAIEIAERAFEAAGELDYPPVVAEARYRLGRAQGMKGDAEQAEENLSESNWLGSSVKHDAIAAAAASSLVHVVGRTMGRHDEGLAWARHAEAHIKRIGIGGIQEARLRHDIGVIHGAADEHANAHEALQQARDLYDKVPFTELARIELLRDVADVRLREGKVDVAIASFEQAKKATTELLGAAHPHVALAIAGLGRVADHQGDPTSARERYYEALAIVTKALGEDAMELVPLHEQLCASYARHRTWDEAIEHSTRAYRLLLDGMGDHPRVAEALHALGKLMVDAGRPDDARRQHEHALAMWEKTRGDDHPDVAYALTSLGLLDLQADAPQTAVERLERALKLRGGRGLDPRLLAQTQFALAQALHGTGGDHPRARELATKARDTLQKGKSPDPAGAAEVDAWLQQTQSG